MVVQNGRGHQVSSIVLLKGSNYPTRKLQCCMVLMREGLWSIFSGTEQAPPNDEAENITKFAARRDRAMALIVLSIEPSLLYLFGDPDDPIVVWQISVKRCGLISCSYGKGCILSS